MKRTIWLLALGLVALAAATGFGLLSDLQAATPDRPTINGTIEDCEYQHHYHDADINVDLYWTITDEDIFIGLRAPASGWVAFGLRPPVAEVEEPPLMQGIDITIGYVKDGQTFIRDDFADQPTGHTADTDLTKQKEDGTEVQGENNIEKYAGSEGDGTTVLEFQRPLRTDDPFDADFPILGEVYLAYSDLDDFVSPHGSMNRTEVLLNFVTGFAEKEREEEEGE